MVAARNQGSRSKYEKGDELVILTDLVRQIGIFPTKPLGTTIICLALLIVVHSFNA